MPRFLPGEENISAQLTKEQIAEIRYLYWNWQLVGKYYLQKELAYDYGVSQAQISRIVNGVHWKEKE
jgi:hypothetical protein